MLIDLTVEEVRIVRNFLETQIADLGSGNLHTHTPDYYDTIKVLRERLKTFDRELSEAST